MKIIEKVEVVDEELECGCTAHIKYDSSNISYGEDFTASIHITHCSECGEVFNIE